MKRKLICFFLFLLMITQFVSHASCLISDKFVSLLIILDEPMYFEELEAWLNDVDYHNFTFAVCDAENPDNYWLANLTRVTFLKNYGVIIPVTSWMQQYETSERQSIVDSVLANWANLVGYSPKGIFDFQPDTYTVNYCKTKNMTYVTGYCFDQYAVDWMTMRGGWQMPYYASNEHVLIPENETLGGMVVFPHQVWDWVSSFTVTHNLHTHVLSLLHSVFEWNVTLTKNYFLELIDRTVEETEPFGFASVQFEWCWYYRNGADGPMKDYIQTLLSTRNYDFWTYEDLAAWFNSKYSTTPAYHLRFISPYDDQRIEWYYCKEFRAARIDDKVVSYIRYNHQAQDQFLTYTFTPNTSLSPHLAENSIDNSLTFEIDALGGGEYRSPIRDVGVTYLGELNEFQIEYVDEIHFSVLLMAFLFADVILLVLLKKFGNKIPHNI